MSALALPLLFPLGALVVAGIVVTAVALGRRRGRLARAGALGEWAARHGWAVAERDDEAAWERPCWPVRRGGRSAHVLRGTDRSGRPARAFEWAFVEEHGTRGDTGSRSRVERVYAVASVDAPDARGAATIEIGSGTPGALRRARRRAPDAVVTGVPAFEARFVLTARDPAQAARLLPPPALDRYATDPRTAAVGVRVHDGTVTCFHRGRLTVAELERLLEVVDVVRALLGPPA